MVRRQRVQTAAFRLGYGAMFLLLIAPLVVLITTSFAASSSFQFPPQGFSLQWYAEFVQSQTWLTAVKNSVIVGTGTILLSTTLSLLAAFGVRESDSVWISRLIPLTLMPLFLPPVVLGVALLSFFGSYNLHQTYGSIIVAHALWATPISFLIIQSVMTQVNWGLQDAALDLGASPLRTKFEVIFPQIKQGLFASALIAFIISLQEFVMALFLSGQETRTIPVLAWTAISQMLDPIVNVISTLLITLVVVVLLLSAFSIGLNRLARQL
ncbi:ABC transporter permease [Haloarcula nitratireducens]|uniref:ABC transporter permease subunit n=1 Tax=Haloarcula nitratireducens TaxID=2487749 RepID=A0AAW4PIF3_9EURY|nr:ABC transporter permease subunit [Halomicroarcula nitratireducens]MBX0297220.1 ABC transporter permease subunit [Halomicroarcula nitratireducens]